jgi:metal-sulfur cluster biosynthetic enzyme/nitrite reductase/ring-hydroxylating ferredoxin subunit
MTNFVRVAKTNDLSDPGQVLLEVDERIVVLFKVGGQYFCLDDVCTHDGGPLSDGKLADHTIACPRHGAKFDIRTGKALTMPATVDTAAHEVKVEGDDILVRICQPGELAKASALAAPTVVGSAAHSHPTIVANSEEKRPGSTHETDEWDQQTARQIVESNTDAYAEGAISEDRVREELKKVIDPELFINIVDLGLIYNVDLAPAAEKINCKIEMTMTSPMCPAGPQLIANSKQVLGALPGMGAVEIKIVLDPPWTPDKMTQEARDQLGIF